MRIEFPDLKGQEGKTLYIIGNGFDLFHGVDTKYKHFYCWLNINKHEDFANNLTRVFPKLICDPYFLWSNLEEAMGEYDLDQLRKDFYVEADNLYWDPEGWCETAKRIDSICMNLPPLLKEWANQVDMSQIINELELSKDSWFLTFNYTRLLEDVYAIPSSHICHIHGCSTNNEDVIVGHNKIVNVDQIYADKDEEQVSKREIAKVMNKFAKNVDNQIRANFCFFNSLKNISHVVVLGHSLSKIDLIYFYRLLDYIQPESNWHFSSHYGGEEKQIEVFLSEANKQKTRIIKKWIFNF